MAAAQDDGGYAWECVACMDDFVALAAPADEPILDVNGAHYCIGCLQKQLEPIARGQEHNGAPKIGDTVISSIPGIMDRIDPVLRQRYEENRAFLASTNPDRRVWCKVRNGSEFCNTYLCQSSPVSEDGRHQWIECFKCKTNNCQACEALQNRDNVSSTDCTTPLRLAKLDEEHRSRDRGRHFSFCAGCDRRMELHEGCNEMDCICGQKFCFICGKKADRTHWESGRNGCPRFHMPDDPRSSGDDVWQDAQDLGGFDFPRLKPGHGDWQRFAAEVSRQDEDIRQWRRVDVEAADVHVAAVKKLLLNARHLFTMISNRMNSPILGLVYGVPHPEQIFERLRFVHHAAQYRSILIELVRMDVDDILPRGENKPGGSGIPWWQAFRLVRPLTFRPRSIETRATWRQDLSTLRLVLTERLYELENDLSDPSIVSSTQRAWVDSLHIARDVFRACFTLTNLLLDECGSSVQFSASISYYTHKCVYDLTAAVNRISSIGEEAFCSFGPDQLLAHQLADFFAHRVFEEYDLEYEQLHHHHATRFWARSQIWTKEIVFVLREIGREQIKYETSNDEPSRVSELRELATMLNKAYHDLAPLDPSEHRPIATADYLTSLEHHYNQLVSGRTDAILPEPGRDILRPLFFESLMRFEELLVIFGFGPRDDMPDRHEDQMQFSWRRARVLYRLVQHEREDQPEPNWLLQSLKWLTLLLFAAVEDDFPSIAQIDANQVADWLGGLRRHIPSPAAGLGVPSLLDSIENVGRRVELAQLRTMMEPAVLQIPWVEAATRGIRAPDTPDRLVAGRYVGRWHEDRIFINGLIRRLRSVGRADELAQERLLLCVERELEKLVEEEWELGDARNSAATIAVFEGAMAELEFLEQNGGRRWNPLLTLADEGRLRQVLADLIDALRVLYPAESPGWGSQGDDGDDSDDDGDSDDSRGGSGGNVDSQSHDQRHGNDGDDHGHPRAPPSGPGGGAGGEQGSPLPSPSHQGSSDSSASSHGDDNDFLLRGTPNPLYTNGPFASLLDNQLAAAPEDSRRAEEPDGAVDRLWHRDANNWTDDHRFITRLLDAYDETGDGLGTPVHFAVTMLQLLLVRIIDGDWADVDRLNNNGRVQSLRQFRDSWRQQQQHWLPPDEGVCAWPRLEQVLWHVLAVLVVLYAGDDDPMEGC